MKIKLFVLGFLGLMLSACQNSPLPASSNLAPVAAFTASVVEGQAPLTIEFDASNSQDDQGIASYSWDFGDGNSATGQQVSHTFNQAGTFTVVLNVIDTKGLSGRQSQVVTVTEGSNPDPNPNPNPATESQIIATVWDASLSAETTADSLTSLAFEVVLISSQNAGTGQVVLTGTLTEISAGNFSYTSSPNDKLVLIRASGAQLEFDFAAFNGDFTGDSDFFLSEDHIANFQIAGNAQAGNLFGKIVHAKVKRQDSFVRDTLASFDGGFTDATGITWAANVTTQGASLFDVDAAKLESIEETTGQLSADSLGLSMNLNRGFRFETINLVFDIEKTFADTWQFAGNSYQMNDVVVRAIFRETLPVDTDQWILQGTLTRNAAQIGQVQDSSDPTKFKFDLVTGDLALTLFERSRF